MNEEVFIFSLIGGLGMSVLAVVVGVWIRPKKGVAGWAMAGSTVVFVLGLLVLLLSIFKIVRMSRPQEPLIGLALLIMTLAVTTFSVGFLCDRWQRRKEKVG